MSKLNKFLTVLAIVQEVMVTISSPRSEQSDSGRKTPKPKKKSTKKSSTS